MDQSAQLNNPNENGTPRKKLYPLLAVGVAVAFAANAWFFYHQGREDASNIDSESMPPAVIAWTRPVSPPSEDAAAQANGDNATATDATANETAKPAPGDTATADKPAPKRTVRAKPANRTMLAKATKPATRMVLAPSERSVALLSHPKPAYPAPALRERQQGTVLVLAQVDVAGRVSDARVVRRSGSAVLDRAAMNEVRRWKFEPALHNGQPIAANVQVPVSYRLEE